MCSCCGSAVTRSNPAIKCQGQCQNMFHLKCAKLPAGLSDLPAESGVVWNCAECTTTAPVLNQLLLKLNALSNDIADIKQHNKEVVKSLNFYGDKIDEFNQKLVKFEETSKTVDKINHEVQDLKNDCLLLRSEIEFLQQQARSNNVEICGVPERNGEDLLAIVKTISDTFNHNLITSDIEEAKRVIRYSKNDSVKLPKNIIIKFKSKISKDNFMQVVRNNKLKKITTKDIYSNVANEEPVYINEHLSPYYKVLFKHAREFCVTYKYRFCWVKDSKILIKKTDVSRTVHVTNENVLQKLIPKE